MQMPSCRSQSPPLLLHTPALLSSCPEVIWIAKITSTKATAIPAIKRFFMISVYCFIVAVYENFLFLGRSFFLDSLQLLTEESAEGIANASIPDEDDGHNETEILPDPFNVAHVFLDS